MCGLSAAYSLISLLVSFSRIQVSMWLTSNFRFPSATLAALLAIVPVHPLTALPALFRSCKNSAYLSFWLITPGCVVEWSASKADAVLDYATCILFWFDTGNRIRFWMYPMMFSDIFLLPVKFMRLDALKECSTSLPMSSNALLETLSCYLIPKPWPGTRVRMHLLTLVLISLIHIFQLMKQISSENNQFRSTEVHMHSIS